ncbi:terpenoid cyclases/protein prenyltransferase alpha-alpha toroid [Dactylonectria estremocensis]|uniref:Terpene cyclase/mutase family member n=1 Tax=Dactylonectria estremocensis TaxID=1079267 RepID=A0A9P9DQ49_9HYPO|nr:terpenoid cyclases/protein prenyltransferase alpha-alpha toroid [Dactylonectria estremocensis]
MGLFHEKAPGSSFGLSTKPPCREKTDLSRWRLRDHDSRHSWHYLSNQDAVQDWPQSHAEKYYLDLPLNLPSLAEATTPLEAARNGLTYFEQLQLPSGHWGCESGGPMVFSVGIIIAWFVTNTPIPEPVQVELKRYLVTLADPVEGGWGLHTTGESTVCGTVINYCVLRILGMDCNDPILIRARSFVHERGGATHSSIWGKFWLAVLGVLDWDIVNPMPPELWLLPDWVPFAPWRFYAEMRLASQPMSYLYSKRWSYGGKLVHALRRELLVESYHETDWETHRNSISAADCKQPHSIILDCASWAFVNIWRPYLRPNFLKKKAESWVSQLIDMQDRNTDYADIAATDAPMNTIICYFRDGPDSVSFKRHLERLQEFLWMTPHGMLINSTNGSQSWDTAFSVQAACHAGLHREERWRDMLLKAYHFLERQQVRENCVSQDTCYRQPRKGGWAFSNKDQGFVVSDCIAEALKAIIMLEKTAQFPKIFDDQRIFDAVDTMMLYQNKTGGVSAFEARRGGEYLELLNLSDIFAKHMVEYDYPECTSSCVTALALFRQYWPLYRTRDIDTFIRRGVSWIKKAQRLDGSWYGSWGICFTYGTMFALEALACVGEDYSTSDSARRACHFLISKQREDGGWSEDFKSCETEEYHENPSGSLVAQTAWAIIGLVEAKYPDPEPLARAAAYLMSRQQANGEWPNEAIPGSFHSFCTFSYPNYKFHFTIKALGLLGTRYPDLKTPWP